MKPAVPVRLPATEIRRHYHARPYATLVVEGGYEEAGDQGRHIVAAGDVLLHPAYSAHHDRVGSTHSFVLDLPLPMYGREWPAIGKIDELDLIIRLAETDVHEAQAVLLERLKPAAHPHHHPADRLAHAVTHDPSLAIGGWAAWNGFSREWLSRRFQLLYGIDAASYRTEARARRAWRRIVESREPLAQVALECGFSDQSHMTRAVGKLTGRSPGGWRRSVTLVQEGLARGL